MVSQNIFFSSKTRTQRHKFFDSNASPQARGHSANTLDEISQDDEDEPPGGTQEVSDYSTQLGLEEDYDTTTESYDNNPEPMECLHPLDYIDPKDPLSELRTYVHESRMISLLEPSFEDD